MIHKFLLITYVVVTFLFTSGCKKDDNKKKPLLTTEPVTAILPITATCGGNITNDRGLGILSRGVVWSTMENPTLENNLGMTYDGPGSGRFVSNLRHLTPMTSYHVRAYATNSAGTGYGMDVPFTTEAKYGTFTDPRDGNVYKWVKIDTLVWMAENLKYLPSVVGPGTFSYTTPYYYVNGYADTSVTEAKSTPNYTDYGVLYNWEAAKAAAPPGWHLPSDAEWKQLVDYLGGESLAGGGLKETGTDHWASPNTEATNKSGFTAFPGGYRHPDGIFVKVGKVGYWWSATDYYTAYAWSRRMIYNYGDAYRGVNDSKVLGFSVRCIRD
jgi:uncharacterized protein (TIGR02145 family)